MRVKNNINLFDNQALILNFIVQIEQDSRT